MSRPRSNTRLEKPVDEATGAATAAPNSEKELRDTLLQFFVCYAPERLPEIPMLMHRYPYQTRSSDITLQLTRDFGQVPADDEAKLCLANDIRTRLFVFYAHYAPNRFDYVDAMIHKYHGRETELWVALERKYGPEKPLHDLYARWETDFDSNGNQRDQQKAKGKTGGDSAYGAPTGGDAREREEVAAKGAAPIPDAAEPGDAEAGMKGAVLDGANQQRERRVSFLGPQGEAEGTPGAGLPPKKSEHRPLASNNASDSAAINDYPDIPWAQSGAFPAADSEDDDDDDGVGFSLSRGNTSNSTKGAGVAPGSSNSNPPSSANANSTSTSEAESPPQKVVPTGPGAMKVFKDGEEYDTIPALSGFKLEKDASMDASYTALLSKVGVSAVQSPHSWLRKKPGTLVYHNADTDFSPPPMPMQDDSSHVARELSFNEPLPTTASGGGAFSPQHQQQRASPLRPLPMTYTGENMYLANTLVANRRKQEAEQGGQHKDEEDEDVWAAPVPRSTFSIPAAASPFGAAGGNSSLSHSANKYVSADDYDKL